MTSTRPCTAVLAGVHVFAMRSPPSGWKRDLFCVCGEKPTTDERAAWEAAKRQTDAENARAQVEAERRR